MKKILLVICIASIFVSAVSAASEDLWAMRSYLEGMGQYNLIFNARDIMAVPADGNYIGMDFSLSLIFNGVFMFGSGSGIYAVYLKKDHIDLKNNKTRLFSAAHDTYITNDEQWGLHYLGLGARKYFFIEDWSVFQFLPYVGLDLGGYFTINTVSKITVKNSGGSVLAAGTMDAGGGFFGVNVETGADFWIMNEVGFVAKLGYRFCGGTIQSVKSAETVPFYGTLGDVYDIETNYSGFYIQLGVALQFQRYD